MKERALCSVLTSSADATKRVAAAIADLARAGDLLVLCGDLGAGKTAFTQGYAAALGVSAPVTSPTFTLANRYIGTELTVHHLDVYRLEQLDEVRDLGLPELLDSESVTLIEWGDAIAPALPNDYIEVSLSFGKQDDDRTIRATLVGPGWATRAAVIERAFEPWMTDSC